MEGLPIIVLRKIRLQAGKVTLKAELNETRTARLIGDALPLRASGNRWGDEIYFTIPVRTSLERGQELVERGDLAYWPTGAAFCLFWGPTPMSEGDEIRPASAVTVVGRILDDATRLSEVPDGAEVVIEAAE